MRNLATLLLSIMVSPPALCALITVADAGGNPLSAYVEADLLQGMSTSMKLSDMQESAKQDLAREMTSLSPEKIRDKALQNIFPVISYALKPMHLTVDIEKPNKAVLNPVAVIGTDRSSRRWLNMNHTTLANMNAEVLLVEAQTIDDLNNYRTAYPTLKIRVQPADHVKEKYGVPGYPVLVTNQGIFQ